jgi:hypothetical protein
MYNQLTERTRNILKMKWFVKPKNEKRQIDKGNEQFSINFLGILKLDVNNPGSKTIILIIVLLLFMSIFVFILKAYVIPMVSATIGKRLVAVIGSKFMAVIKLFKF